MQKTGGRYYDDNENSWDADKYSEEQALKASKSLINCWDCQNCQNCWDCWGCQNCRGCRGCRGCQNCRDCRDCQSCQNCRYCWDCRDCQNCRDCRDCQSCLGCRDCRGCQNCQNCQNCSLIHNFKKNPARLIIPGIGSRRGTTTIYWTDERDLVICGCFKAPLAEFEKKVEARHGNNRHGDSYRLVINTVKALQKKLKRGGIE